MCEPEQRFKSAAKIMQHPWFAGVQWDAVHNLKSPLCADTEFYAQRHFPRIEQPGTGDNAEGGGPSSRTQRKPYGDTATATNKPKLGAPVPLDKYGTSARAGVRPPPANVGAEVREGQSFLLLHTYVEAYISESPMCMHILLLYTLGPVAGGIVSSSTRGVC